MDRSDPASSEVAVGIGRLLLGAGVPLSMLEEMYCNPRLLGEVAEVILGASQVATELPKTPHEDGLSRFVARLTSVGRLYEGGIRIAKTEVERLHAAMAGLDDRSVKVVVLHFGLEDGIEVPLARVGEALHLSVQGVEGILASTLLRVVHRLYALPGREGDTLTA